MHISSQLYTKIFQFEVLPCPEKSSVGSGSQLAPGLPQTWETQKYTWSSGFSLLLSIQGAGARHWAPARNGERFMWLGGGHTADRGSGNPSPPASMWGSFLCLKGRGTQPSCCCSSPLTPAQWANLWKELRALLRKMLYKYSVLLLTRTPGVRNRSPEGSRWGEGVPGGLKFNPRN